MEKKAKGRPTKPSPKRKRLHYSVWVSAEEKQQIDQLIEQANLPASQFFLTQVLEKPIQRPKKKNLPKSVQHTVGMLDKLSGLFALSVLKAKDRDMQQAENWQQSSQNIKWISHLIALKIFEDFDFPMLKKTLENIEKESQNLYWILEAIERNDLAVPIQTTKKMYHAISNLLVLLAKYYEIDTQPERLQQIWNSDFDIHQEIEQLKQKLLKR